MNVYVGEQRSSSTRFNLGTTWRISHFGRFTPCTHSIGCWADPWTRLDISGKIKLFNAIQNGNIGGEGAHVFLNLSHSLLMSALHPRTHNFSNSKLQLLPVHTNTKPHFLKTQLWCIVPEPEQGTSKLVASQEISLPKYSTLYSLRPLRVAYTRTQQATRWQPPLIFILQYHRERAAMCGPTADATC